MKALLSDSDLLILYEVSKKDQIGDENKKQHLYALAQRGLVRLVFYNKGEKLGALITSEGHAIIQMELRQRGFWGAWKLIRKAHKQRKEQRIGGNRNVGISNLDLGGKEQEGH